MNAPQRSFVFFPMFDSLPDEHNPGGHDATGAFQPGASMYRKYYTDLGNDVVMCKFDNHQPGPKRRKQILNALAVGAGDGWFDAIIYFGHGWKGGLSSAGFNNSELNEFSDACYQYGNFSVTVMLYACSCAVDNGACYRISQSLQSWYDQASYRVLGHYSVGHSFLNPQVHEYPNSGSVKGLQTAPEGKQAAFAKAIRAKHSDLWLRFPFMSQDELDAELG